MIKLAFSTNAFVKHTLESAISEIANIGYDGVEILADKPHAFFPIRKNRQSKITETIRKHKIAISNINANTARGFFDHKSYGDPFEPSLASNDEKKRLWRINYTKQAIDFASLINAENISVTSGKPVSGERREENVKRFMDSMHEVVKYASARKIKIGIEYEPGLLVGNADESLDVIKQIGSQYLGVNLDIGHSQVIGEDIPQVIKMFGKRIFNVHLYDIKGRRHYHLMPGKGDIDFRSVFKSLKSVAYERYFTVELYTYPHRPVSAASKALSYLKQIAG
jgi:sugar phosphate isomerase/epimerase